MGYECIQLDSKLASGSKVAQTGGATLEKDGRKFLSNVFAINDEQNQEPP